MGGSRKRVWSDYAKGAEDTEQGLAGASPPGLDTRCPPAVMVTGHPAPAHSLTAQLYLHVQKTGQPLLYPKTKPQSSRAQRQAACQPGTGTGHGAGVGRGHVLCSGVTARETRAPHRTFVRSALGPAFLGREMQSRMQRKQHSPGAGDVPSTPAVDRASPMPSSLKVAPPSLRPECSLMTLSLRRSVSKRKAD